jgi:hypothetical protein
MDFAANHAEPCVFIAADQNAADARLRAFLDVVHESHGIGLLRRELGFFLRFFFFLSRG